MSVPWLRKGSLKKCNERDLIFNLILGFKNERSGNRLLTAHVFYAVVNV